MGKGFSYARPNSHALEDHPRLPRVFNEATSAINDMREGLGLPHRNFSPVHVNIIPRDEWPDTEKRHHLSNCVGIYDPASGVAFVKNQIPSNIRHARQLEGGIRETGKVLVHELTHMGAGGGLHPMTVLDEGITERASVDIFASRVHSVLSGPICFQQETDGIKIWDSIVRTSSRQLVTDILQSYWQGEAQRGIAAVINAFGRKAFALLRRRDLSIAEWEKLFR